MIGGCCVGTPICCVSSGQVSGAYGKLRSPAKLVPDVGCYLNEQAQPVVRESILKVFSKNLIAADASNLFISQYDFHLLVLSC